MDKLKQPQLGQTIQSLRQEKKMTQDELVELCNVNVRTIQRIEAGEVTPRDYTVRAILNALGHEFEQVESSIRKKISLNRMQIGWVAGIIYFVFGLIETGVDFSRFDPNNPIYFSLIYIAVKAISLVSFGLLMIGFVEVGKMFGSSLLKIASYLMIGSFAVIELYDIVSLFSGITETEFWMIKGGEGIIFGSIDVIFGIALFKLGKEMGTIGRAAGIFEIVAGALFVTIILAFLGLFLLIPATILEIILLHKCFERLKSSE